MPFAVMSTSSKDGTVTFSDVAKSPAYVGAVYKGEAGKTANVEFTFDDTVKIQ